MPHAALKLIPGVDQNRTPALNEAAISSCNLIRFVPDKQGLGLVQKLGGWTKFYPNSIGSIVRALWAWEDTNANSYLAVGAQSTLSYIINGNQLAITPRQFTDNVAVNISYTTGSSTFTITDTGSNITQYDSVYITTPIAAGGVVLFGFYPCTNCRSGYFLVICCDNWRQRIWNGGHADLCRWRRLSRRQQDNGLRRHAVRL